MPRFFGLTPNDKEIFLEQIWVLMYYIGFSYTEAYRLPLRFRTWFIERLQKEFKDRNDESPSKATHHNPPDMRALQGLRPDAPPRLRRFT